jgi:hypothetical protein
MSDQDEQNANGFDHDAFEAYKESIREQYAYDENPEVADNICDDIDKRFVIYTGNIEFNRFVASLNSNVEGGAMDGLEFLTTEREEKPPLWGTTEKPLWESGQGMLVVGPQGVGKSNVAQLLVFARMGIHAADLFDFPVVIDERPVLYLAMDRPRQIYKSMNRMVDLKDEDVRAKLKRQLIVWPKQPPFKADLDPERFAQWVAETGRDPGLVIADSVKDMLTSIVADEAGLGFNTTVQMILANRTEFLGNHHQRKPGIGNPKPNTLADVYGSNWITAGQGSVILLWGTPGASSVELRHLKLLREPVGPLLVNYDHDSGSASGGEPARMLINLAYEKAPNGFTLDEAVKRLHGTTRVDDDWKADSQRVSRRCVELVDLGKLGHTKGTRGGAGGGGTPATWTVGQNA